MASRSAVRISPGSFRSIQGVEALQAKIAGLPPAVADNVKPALQEAADIMVGVLKPIVPRSPLEAPGGERLADSVRSEPGDHDLAIQVVEDGKDKDGKPIAAHVEQGHMAPDGTHVAAVPHFWPAYRVSKKRMRAAIARGVRKGIKASLDV